MKRNESTFILHPLYLPEELSNFYFICACTVNEKNSHEADYPRAQLANGYKKIYKYVFLNSFKLSESFVVTLCTAYLTLKSYAFLTFS
jgi:hypothetical protein